MRSTSAKPAACPLGNPDPSVGGASLDELIDPCFGGIRPERLARPEQLIAVVWKVVPGHRLGVGTFR